MDSMPSIFISYRRDDTAPYAGRIADHLTAHFGGDQIFLDVDAFLPGQDFTQALQQRLSAADVVIVLIGPQWLTCADDGGHRRLDSAGDYVRQEVVGALDRAVPIIPVLAGGAAMPKAEELPESISTLAHLQALEVTDARFRSDMNHLIATLARVPKRRRGPRLHLRAEPVTLSGAEAKVMLVRHNFYCAEVNETGTGIGNEFEAQIAGASVVIVDHATDLMWEKGGSAEGVPASGPAATYIKGANERKLAGHNDWRLPTLEESMSLMTPKTHNSFHMDPVFEPMAAPFVWTSDLRQEDRGWVVYYYDGFFSPERLNFNAYIRLVRSLGR